jgi:uncharacterized RDD family membrane protein YckC
MKLKIIFYFTLVLLNLVSLYFVIALFSYDEMVGYLIDGVKQVDSPRELAYLLFITALSNLYFVVLGLMEYFFNNQK